MKLYNLVIVGIALEVLAGCAQRPQSTREGPEGKKISVAVTDNKFPIT